MADLVRLLWEFVLDYMRPSEQLRAQNAVLRYQLNIARRKASIVSVGGKTTLVTLWKKS